MRFTHTLRFLALPMAPLATALTLACSDGSPTSADEGPLLAATSGPLSVDPRSLRIKCNVGTTCTGGMIVSSSSTVTLSYQIDGSDFIINPALTTCPQDGTLTGGCFMNVKVASTDTPGRRTATLVISESSAGTSLSVRLSANVR